MKRHHGERHRRPSAFIGLMLLSAILLGGCAQQTRVPLKRLPVIPLQQQISEVNTVARRIQTLRLTGELTIHYFNRHNQPQSLSLHGVLLLKRLDSAAQNSSSSRRKVEALLLTTYLGQNAMELGVNRHGYWLINHQKNIAYIGALDSRGQTPPGVLPLNPAELPALLGFATLPTNGLTIRTVIPGADHTRLLVLGYEDGRLTVRRQITVSRYTGRIDQVTLFGAGSRAEAICHLRRYPLVAPDALEAAGTPVAQLICRQFSITVPERHIRIEFDVHHVQSKLPAKARFIFRRPSLRGDTVHVIAAK
jgi:hypothetical protein